MFKIKKIDHVAVCVHNIDDAQARWLALFGLTGRQREEVESQKTEVVLLPLGDSNLELIAPRGNEALARFLHKRGPGLPHIAIKAEATEQAPTALQPNG